jgi:hypothetical protein
MADRQTLYNPAVTINGLDVKFTPNSITYTEGFGEAKVRTRSGGGGATDTVYSKDLETAYSTFKISVRTTADMVELIRIWLVLENDNIITLTDSDTLGNQLLSRTFKHAAIINNPTVNISADGDVELEFHGDPVI